MKVIFLRVDDNIKKNLELEALKLGLSITAYCRMVLIKSLEKTK